MFKPEVSQLSSIIPSSNLSVGIIENWTCLFIDGKQYVEGTLNGNPYRTPSIIFNGPTGVVFENGNKCQLGKRDTTNDLKNVYFSSKRVSRKSIKQENDQQNKLF